MDYGCSIGARDLWITDVALLRAAPGRRADYKAFLRAAPGRRADYASTDVAYFFVILLYMKISVHIQETFWCS